MIPHPFYFGCFPILVFYAIYAMFQMPPDVLVVPLIVQIVATILVCGMFLVVLRNADKAAIATTILTTAFFAPTYLFLLYKTSALLGLDKYGMKFIGILLISIWAALIGALLVVLTKRLPLEKPRKLLNEVGGFLLLLEVLVIFTHEAQVKFLWEPKQEVVFSKSDQDIYRQALVREDKTRLDRPDIYCILLDENPSSFVLKKYFDYDNQWFVDELRKRGFVVAERSHSNYPWTLLSVTSWLNMTHMTQLESVCGKDTTDWSSAIQLLRNARAIELFKKCGYRFIQFGSMFSPTDWNPNADENVIFSPLNNFTVKLLETTSLGLLSGSEEFFDRKEREHKLFVLSRLKNIEASKEPIFVFAHLVIPHEPFLFDQEGNPVHVKEETRGGKWSPDTKEGFKNQTIFVEHKILETIDGILHNSKSPPIILLQGDHGPNSQGSIAVDSPNEDVLVERYGCLSAYLVPTAMRKEIYDDISPVNILRLVSNEILGSQFGLLPDSSFHTTYPYPYRFQNLKDIKDSEPKQK